MPQDGRGARGQDGARPGPAMRAAFRDFRRPRGILAKAALMASATSTSLMRSWLHTSSRNSLRALGSTYVAAAVMASSCSWLRLKVMLLMVRSERPVRGNRSERPRGRGRGATRTMRRARPTSGRWPRAAARARPSTAFGPGICPAERRRPPSRRRRARGCRDRRVVARPFCRSASRQRARRRVGVGNSVVPNGSRRRCAWSFCQLGARLSELASQCDELGLHPDALPSEGRGHRFESCRVRQ